MYSATYDEDWICNFEKLEPDTKIRVIKKIGKILENPQKRHLKGNARFFVDEIGQYRILFRIFEDKQEVRFYFVGNHKDYERFYSGFL